VLGIFFVTIGLIVSYFMDVPSGATIILTAATTFFVFTLISR